MNWIKACGFNGHGFKFVSGTGEILTDPVIKSKTDSPIEIFKIGKV